MTYPHGGASQIWRDSEGGAPHNPDKSQIREWGERVEGFEDVAGLIVDASVSLGATGDFISAGGFRYKIAAPSASDYHIATAGGVKLLVSELSELGGVQPRALGAYFDGVSRPLSTRYTSLALAQAAFPRCHAAGYITSLADEIDWATMQEAMLIAQNTKGLPHVSCGWGHAKINRGLVVLGNNKGFRLVGDPFAAGQQGSTDSGFILEYTGNGGEYIWDTQGTFYQVQGVSFKNRGNAKAAVRFTGVNDGAFGAGGGRSHVIDCSFVTRVGDAEYSEATIRHKGATDYTRIEDNEFTNGSPVMILCKSDDGNSSQSTVTTIRNNVFTALNVSSYVVRLIDINIETLIFENNTVNKDINSTTDTTVIDTTLVNSHGLGSDLSVLYIKNSEFDCKTSANNSRFVRANRIRNLVMEQCVMQRVGGTGPAIELTDSHAIINGGEYISLAAPIVSCLDGDTVSTCRFLAPPLNYTTTFTNGGGLVSPALRNNCVELEQVSGVSAFTLDGFGKSYDPTHAMVNLKISNNATTQLQCRSLADTPKGNWVHGQLLTLKIRNETVSNYNGCNLNAGIQGGPITAIPSGHTIAVTFTWNQNSSQFEEISRCAPYAH